MPPEERETVEPEGRSHREANAHCKNGPAGTSSAGEGCHGIAFCVGAALEFITDQQKRAPALVRRLRLEWAHRLVTNPRRLWRRYLLEGPAIFLLTYRWRKSVA